MPSESYSKLFSSITTSTIWCEPDHVRIVWITMLALSDRHGYVGASVPGLAQIARVSLDHCREAIECFKSPDPDSRTKAFEGRRIADADRGWTILNYADFRKRMDAEAAKEAKRRWWAENRGAGAKEAAVTPEETSPEKVNSIEPLDDELDNTSSTRDITDSSSDSPKALKALKSKTLAQPAARFSEFWTLYPRKVGKAAAEKAWCKLAPDADAVVDGLSAQLAAGMFRELRYTPHGATYLNGRRWEDPPERPQAPPPMAPSRQFQALAAVQTMLEAAQEAERHDRLTLPFDPARLVSGGSH